MKPRSLGIDRACIFVLILLLTGCGGETKPLMDLTRDGFFAFPWPNEIRKRENGSIDLDGFPANFNPIFSYIAARGETYSQDFGPNHGVFFQFSNRIDGSQLPSIDESLQDDSPVMLVNIDPSSPGYLARTPLRLNFSSLKTLYKPGNLLAAVPLPGYSLDADAEYAAIIFTGIKDTQGNPIEKANLLGGLQQNELPPGVTSQHWQQLQGQWQKVNDYVEAHTQWSRDQIAAFSVYKTQQPTKYAFAVAEALRDVDDQTIIDSVMDVQIQETCQSASNVEISGKVRLPSWQRGKAPYLIAGGFIGLDEDGHAQIQGYEEVDFYVVIGCLESDGPRKVVVGAPGSGDGPDMSDRLVRQYMFSYEFNQIAISVPPHQTGSRAHPVGEDVTALLNKLGVTVNWGDIPGLIYYNPFNTPASVGNHIQGAADYIYIRRLATLLQPIFAQQGLDIDALDLPANALDADLNSAALVAQSQGAGNAPIAMAMDPTFNIGYFNAASSHAYPQAIHRYSVRKLLTTAFAGLVENEINDFHPIMQLMQLAHEPSDNVNYVPFIQPGDLLFTAGWRDGCVPREGAGALGLALVRYGLVELNLKHGKFHSFVDPTSFMEAGPGLPFFDFPLYQANLDNGKYGLFIELATGHDANGAEYTQSDFLANTLGLPGADGEIQASEVTSFGGTCDERYDNVY